MAVRANPEFCRQGFYLFDPIQVWIGYTKAPPLPVEFETIGFNPIDSIAHNAVGQNAAGTLVR